MSVDLLQSIRNIDKSVKQASSNVYSAIKSVYDKAKTISEYYNGNDLSIFDVFQESDSTVFLESLDNIEDKNEFKIAEEAVKKILKDTEEDAIKLKISKISDPNEIKPLDSVIGGEKPPYAEMVPEINGRKLQFFVQINCENLKNLKNFPHKGILQFWYDDAFSESGSYVLYYENPTNNKVDELDFTNTAFKYEDECPILNKAIGRLSFENIKDHINCSVDEFGKMFADEYNSIAKKYTDVSQIRTYYNLPIAITNAIEKKFPQLWRVGYGHKVGGYPFFTQYDPIGYSHEYKNKRRIQLLQVDSEWPFIQWGDSGVAHFFISEDDLKKLKFDNVMFTWDCH